MIFRLLILVLVLAFSKGVKAQTLKDARARLNALKNDLNEKRQALRGLEKKGLSLFYTLGDLNRSLYKMEARLKEATREEEAALADRRSIEEQLKIDTEDFVVVKKRLKKRLRALYVMGEGAIPRALLGVDSFEDLSFRKRLMAQMTRNDVLLFKHHRELKNKVEQAAEILRARVEAAVALREEIELETELVAAARSERKAAIARIDEEKELAVDAVRENVRQQRELTALLAGILRSRPARKKRGKGVLANGLLRPAKGELIRRFGTVRERGTGARLVSNGMHWRMPRGSAVRAAANGYVVHEGWMRGFGQLIILDHGEGHHTLYAHLSETFVKQGDTVDEGKIMAHSGDSESLNGDKLYFELRAAGRPINPEPYLRD